MRGEEVGADQVQHVDVARRAEVRGQRRAGAEPYHDVRRHLMCQGGSGPRELTTAVANGCVEVGKGGVPVRLRFPRGSFASRLGRARTP